MENQEIILKFTNPDEDWRYDRLQLLTLLVKEKTEFAINFNSYWVHTIEDHKGNLTFYWNYCPHQIIFDIIGEVWEQRFIESSANINHEFHI
jgi:hypothetical protein